MEQEDFSKRAEARRDWRMAGRSFDGSLAIFPLKSDVERAVLELPINLEAKESLQNDDGSFKYAPRNDGTLVGPGRYGIDSFGRFVDLDTLAVVPE